MQPKKTDKFEELMKVHVKVVKIIFIDQQGTKFKKLWVQISIQISKSIECPYDSCDLLPATIISK